MKKSIEYHTKLITDINQVISNIVEQSDSNKRSDITGIRSDISDIRRLLQQDSPSDIGLSSIRIRFYGEYELKLPKYGVESFDRTLKGEMYFKVMGGNNDFLDIKTNSFSDYFKIRLYYSTLNTYKNQRGKAFLIYNRGTQKLVGEDTTIDFKIIKKS